MPEAHQPARSHRNKDGLFPQEFSSADELRNHYKALKRRMRGDTSRPVVVLKPLEPEVSAEVPVAPVVVEKKPEPLPPELVDPSPHAESILTLTDAHTFVSRVRILTAVSEAARLSLQEIVGRSRSRHLVDARFVYYVLARTYSGASLPQIGATAGYRDHSTVMHGLRQGRARAVQLMPLYKRTCEILKVPVPDLSEPMEVQE